jgi:hypothetical protein
MRKFFIVFAVAAAIGGFAGCGGGGGGGTDGGGGVDLDPAALVGIWDTQDDVDETVIHFYANGDYVLENSTTPLDVGGENPAPVFIFGKYSVSGDNLILEAERAEDAGGNQINNAVIDSCWIFAPSIDRATFTNVEIRDGAETSEMYLAGGWSVLAPTRNSGCEDLPVNQPEVLWSLLTGDTPGVWTFK